MLTPSDSLQLDEIWSMALTRIREDNDYSNTIMKLWFEDLKLTILTEDTAVFVIRSDFKRDIIYSRYLNVIARAIRDTVGFDVSVSIRSVQQESNLTERMTAAAEQAETKVNPETDFYSTVGNNRVLNRASVPTAFAEFTFENFVVGKANQFAHAAALSVATQPAGQANPLFIYGNSGLGKTHLLYAITHRIKENFPDYRVVYVKGEEFTNQMIDAISRNLNVEFREKYRSADVLLIDDIQFIAGREATQEEFFHTFNQLYENGKQIILASDLPPRDIKRLEERLRTRFECGVIADINPPDLELRTAIVKKKAQNIGAAFTDEVMDYIAENLTSNVRQLEGAVKRIWAQCMLTGEPVSLDLAVRCISDQMVGSESVTVTIDKILNAVSTHYGLTVEDLKSRKRTSNVAFARHVAIYMIKKLTDRSLPAIGRVFGRDHTTILNSIDTVEKRLATDTSFESEVKELIRTVKKR
ncbi:MAG: chromosomal replication initiator protein DnaA [Ruminococcaceae bacterium]|nr:chromosomal replication initiator protein DnaA [Oscillospiraceae bacterium]